MAGPEADALSTQLARDIALFAYTASGSESWPIYPVAANFGHDKLMNGTATITVPLGDDLVTRYQGSTLGQEFPEIVIRAFRRGATKPLWVGVVINTRLVSRGFNGTVDVTCEHIWQHLHRRRLVLNTAINVVDFNEEADNIALKVTRMNIGPAPTVPAGHPTTRVSLGSFSVSVAANHSPALAPTRRFVEQSGNSLLDVMNQLYESADLRPVLTDANSGAFTLDCDYPFAENDLTDSIVFGQYRGNLTSFELTSDRTGLANVWALEGKTAKTPQWAADAASITLWGEFEAYATKGEDAAVPTALLRTVNDLRDGYGPARIMYKAEVVEIDNHRFGIDWFWGDTIRFEEAVLGFYAEQTVTAWEIGMTDGVVRTINVTLGVPRAPDLMRHVIGYTGAPGRWGGSPWRNRRQA